MTKKSDISQHLVQAYQSPYNNELFPLDKREAFEKHLRHEARIAKERASAQAATDERKRQWAVLRESATSMDDVSSLLKGLPPEMAVYYRKTAFFKSSRDAGWTLTMANVPKLGLQSITHDSPLGQPTNWGGRDKERPVYLLGISGTAKENLNYLFSEAKRESGISTCNSEYTLFADDWPFVAKMALLATFDKTIQLPEKYTRANGKFTESIKPEYTRFWDDIERYSLAYTGMAYSELQGMRDSLDLSKDDLITMMASYALNKNNALSDSAAMTLPEGLGFDCMQNTV